MKNFYLLIICLLFILQSLPVNAQFYTNNNEAIAKDLEQMKSDIEVIQRQLYRDKNNMESTPQETTSSILVKMGEYDELLRNMNGRVESVENRLAKLEENNQMINKDIDLRFEQLKRLIPTSGNTTQKQTTKSDNVKITDKKYPTAKSLYDEALTNLINNKFDIAEKQFTKFLKDYPKETLAGNAQYWLGEVYYKQEQFAKAAVAFKDGFSKYPDGIKTPDCLLKLGLSMKALKKNTEACTAFTNIPSLKNKIDDQIMTRAKKEIKELGCK